MAFSIAAKEEEMEKEQQQRKPQLFYESSHPLWIVWTLPRGTGSRLQAIAIISLHKYQTHIKERRHHGCWTATLRIIVKTMREPAAKGRISLVAYDSARGEVFFFFFTIVQVRQQLGFSIISTVWSGMWNDTQNQKKKIVRKTKQQIRPFPGSIVILISSCWVIWITSTHINNNRKKRQCIWTFHTNYPGRKQSTVSIYFVARKYSLGGTYCRHFPSKTAGSSAAVKEQFSYQETHFSFQWVNNLNMNNGIMLWYATYSWITADVKKTEIRVARCEMVAELALKQLQSIFRWVEIIIIDKIAKRSRSRFEFFIVLFIIVTHDLRFSCNIASGITIVT